MSPILGIWASAQTAAATIGDYESIATTTVGAGGAASITFSSIPSTYQHLQIRVIARGTGSFTDQEQYITFNGSASNYYGGHLLYGNGTSALANVASYTTVNVLPRLVAASSTASVFTSYVTDILDYANTSKNKTIRSLGGFDANGSGEADFHSGLWMDTSAITSINIRPSTNNFAQYSSFALYGIK
jgi:hypothetical protein